MKRIRVLEVVEATAGGTRRHVTDLVCHLPPDRFELSVYCSLERDPDFARDIARMRERGVGVTVSPMRRAISPLRDAAAFFRLWRHLRRNGYDIVHTHSSKAGFLGRWAAAAAGVPVVLHTPHTFAFQMGVAPPLRLLYRLLERTASRVTDRFVCVSRSEREAAEAAGVAAAERCVVIENGVPAEAFEGGGDRAARRRELGLAAEAPVVGMAGRFEPQKGHRDLVLAAARVAQRVPGVRFVLLGEGTLVPEVKRLIGNLGLEGVFLLPGIVEDATAYYVAFDVMALPSRWESLPYSLLEAMAAGKAIAATRVGGMPEALDEGRAGRLVPPGDPGAMAEALAGLLQAPAERQALGEAARERARARYRLEDMVARVAELYASAVAAGAIE
jgi:glycosyltransferase involved in cell wall biosynthesis